MEKRYRVTLTESERVDLRKLVSVGKAAAQKLVRARILLLADQAEGGSSKSDPEIVESLGCGRASVERVRKRFGQSSTTAPGSRQFGGQFPRRGRRHAGASTGGRGTTQPSRRPPRKSCSIQQPSRRLQDRAVANPLVLWHPRLAFSEKLYRYVNNRAYGWKLTQADWFRQDFQIRSQR